MIENSYSQFNYELLLCGIVYKKLYFNVTIVNIKRYNKQDNVSLLFSHNYL